MLWNQYPIKSSFGSFCLPTDITVSKIITYFYSVWHGELAATWRRYLVLASHLMVIELVNYFMCQIYKADVLHLTIRYRWVPFWLAGILYWPLLDHYSSVNMDCEKINHTFRKILLLTLHRWNDFWRYLGIHILAETPSPHIFYILCWRSTAGLESLF